MTQKTPLKYELKPMPIRVTDLQFARLQGARKQDGLSMQEHIRRALDFYLSRLEKGSLWDVEAAPQELAPAEMPAMPPAKARGGPVRVRAR